MVFDITFPISQNDILSLHAGDMVSASGTVYTARDAAHKRLYDALINGRPLPVDLKGQAIYYLGPTPPPPGRPIGSAGPTSSHRMDKYAPALFEYGVNCVIGKGKRSDEVKRSIIAGKCIYLGATGGAGALLASHITECESVAYEDLGPEAIFRLRLDEFPLVVLYDAFGGDTYSDAQKAYSTITEP